jgi:hypothetical protein
VSTTAGAHVLTATTSLPNGAVDEIPTNDAATSNYNADGQTVKVVITTDLDGSGTTWVIYDQFFSPNTYSGGPYGNSTTYTETVCLSTALGNQWSFYLFDSFGDGICCANGNGSWQLRDRFDRSILADKGQFTTQSPPATPLSPAYANGHEFTLPLGPAQPQSGECGVFTNLLQAAAEGATLGVMFLAVDLLSRPEGSSINWSSKPILGSLPQLGELLNSLPRNQMFLILLAVAVLLKLGQSLAMYLGSVAVGYYANRTSARLTAMLHEAGFDEVRLVRNPMPLQTQLIVARPAPMENPRANDVITG